MMGPFATGHERALNTRIRKSWARRSGAQVAPNFSNQSYLIFSKLVLFDEGSEQRFLSAFSLSVVSYSFIYWLFCDFKFSESSLASIEVEVSNFTGMFDWKNESAHGSTATILYYCAVAYLHSKSLRLYCYIYNSFTVKQL